MPASTWSLQVLGPLRIARSGAGGEPAALGAKASAVLAWLAARPDHQGSRAALLDLLWTESPIDQARTAMRQCLFNLRAELGDANPVRGDREALSLAAASIDVDLPRFLRLASAPAKEDRLAACGLYLGDYAEELRTTPAFDAWMASERRKVRHVAVRLLEQCAADASPGCEATTVDRLAHTLLARDPLHEGCWRALMTLYSRCGLHAEAEAVWHECRQVLRTQAGVDPSPDTVRVHADLAASHSRHSAALLLGKAMPTLKRDAAAAAAHDHFLRGWQHYFDGSAADNARAREAFEAAAALEPGRSDYPVIAAWTHFTDFNFGWNGPVQASYMRAAGLAQQLRERYPQDPWPHVLQAKLATWRGDWECALETFDHVQSDLVQDAPTWANHADALLRTGQTARAMEHIERAMELNPADRGFFHFIAGKIHFALRDLDSALASFEAALRRNGNFCLAWRGIAAVKAEFGRIDDAREALSQCRPGSSLQPALAYSMHLLGPYADEELVMRWRQAWTKAGLRPRLSLPAARA